MEGNSQKISKEMIQTKEGHFDKSTSITENNLLLDITSPNHLSDSSDKLADTGVLSDEHALLFKRKTNLKDKVHCKKYKAGTETILGEELTINELEQVSEVEKTPSTHVSRKKLLGSSSSTNHNLKGIKEPRRMSGKEYYVTFSDELSAEKAVCLSGYRLKIHNKDEAPYNGILSVEYAEAELDQDCLNSSQDAKDPDVDNSDYEFSTLLEKVKNENTFRDALSDTIGLLEQKKNSKKNTIDLFPLMRHIYCQVLYLVVEKGNFELDVTKSKFAVIKQILKTSKLLVDIELAFKLSLEIKESGFTKQKRKNIEIWKKHCREYITLFMEEVAFYETSLDEQNIQPMENTELHQENMFPEDDLEDSEGCNQENLNRKDDYSCPSASFPTDSNDEVLFIIDKLNKEETFLQAADTLITWLEYDICSDENARSFFSMIQSIHNHVMKLCDKKDKYEETLKSTKEVLIKHFEEILFNLTKVERIYLTITLEKCFKYFTSDERRNIELWMNYANKLKSNMKEKIRIFRREVNRSLSGSQFCQQMNDNIQKLKEQHNSLHRQFKEVQNNITSMRNTYKKDFDRLDDELTALNKAMTKSQKNVLKLKEKCFITEVELRELRNSIYRHDIENEMIPDSPAIPQELARVIALVSIFLRFSPGASLESICSYLHGNDATIDCGVIENVMRRFSSMFQERIIGIGANVQKKWYYLAV